MFANKEVEKVYLAVTIGDMPITGSVATKIDGKNALTHYEVMQSISSKRFNRLNLVKLMPITGRRHQIRIHVSSIGHPILGDKKYGSSNLLLKGKGMYLHAYSLKLAHPHGKQTIHITDPMPRKFCKLFDVDS